ncbi:MAG: subclass B3 metallo-beta-lactamase [Acidobacteria bacterium]|nr:MAG: subclass B3 metallo-beta-lactamase [Acidobacteriota bacterium]
MLRPPRPAGALPLLVAIAAALTLAPATAGQDDAAFEIPESWLRPVEPFAVADGVYWVGSEELAAYLLTGDEGHVLIDAPMEQNAERILASVRALGFDPADIEIVLATHGHFDHTGAVAAVIEATGAELWLLPAAAELVGAGGRGDFFLGDRAGYPPARAARVLADGEEVRRGELRLRALATPGHTRGCTSWSFRANVDSQPVEAVLVCSLSVLPGYRLVGESASYVGIGSDFCRSLAKLEALEPELFLSNHGSFLGLETKRRELQSGVADAFVDPEGYRDYLRRARLQIEDTLREQGGQGCSDLLRRPGKP